MVNQDILNKDIDVKTLDTEKGSVLAHIKAEMNELTDAMRDTFATKYKARVDKIKEKYKDEDTKIIVGSKESFVKLLTQIKEENADKNEEADAVTTDDKSEKKLSEVEIDTALDTFEKDMSPKTPEAPAAATPEKPVEPVNPATQSAIQEAQKFFENKWVKLDTAPAQTNWAVNIIKKLILDFYGMLEGFGIDVRGKKAKLEGYKDYDSKQKVDETFKVLSEYMGESVKWITDIKDKEALVAKMEWLGLPLLHGDNILAGPIMKIVFTGEESAWNDLPDDFDTDILKAVRGKYLTLKDNPRSLGGMTTLQKLNEIFTIEENMRASYITLADYSEPEIPTSPNIPTSQTTTPEHIPTDEEIKKIEMEQIKTAQDADEKLIKMQKELDNANTISPAGSAKVAEAKTKFDEAKKSVGTITEWSKVKITETLNKAESNLADLKISIELDTTKITDINKKFLASSSKDQEIEKTLNDARKELKNLEVKKWILETAISGIKKEIEKFSTDNTKTITATEAVRSLQETERLYSNSGDIAQIQVSADEKEKEGQAFSENLEALKKDMEDILYTSEEDYWEIDNPEDVTELQRKLETLIKWKNEELLNRNDWSITDLKSKIEFSLAKIDLIKLWKMKEKEWNNAGQNINYGSWWWDGLIDIDGTDIDIDIAWDTDDNVLMKTNDGNKLVPTLWGAQGVLSTIRKNELKLKGEIPFQSKKWTNFSINTK